MVEIKDLGTAEYNNVLDLQKELVQKRLADEIPDTLIFVEHPSVVTLGRLAKDDSLIDRGYFERKRIPVVRAGRGGKITWHAPGQLVLYPVLDLNVRKKDISFYIDFLEKTVVEGLRRLGVPAERSEERRGVWARGKKIAFIGIAVKRWITFHGVSININNDIEPFSRMHPCGEKDIEITSAKRILKRELNMSEVKNIFAEQFIRDIEECFSGITNAGIVRGNGRGNNYSMASRGERLRG